MGMNLLRLEWGRGSALPCPSFFLAFLSSLPHSYSLSPLIGLNTLDKFLNFRHNPHTLPLPIFGVDLLAWIATYFRILDGKYEGSF